MKKYRIRKKNYTKHITRKVRYDNVKNSDILGYKAPTSIAVSEIQTALQKIGQNLI